MLEEKRLTVNLESADSLTSIDVREIPPMCDGRRHWSEEKVWPYEAMEILFPMNTLPSGLRMRSPSILRILLFDIGKLGTESK